MAYVELSYLVNEKTPNYPDAPKDRVIPLERQSQGDSGNTSVIHHFAHNGTHLDTPFHFDSQGKQIQDLAFDNFIYHNPVFLEIPKNYQEEISLSDLHKFDISRADAVLIRTGFDEIRNKEPLAYRILFPGLSLETAEYLRNSCKNLKAVLVDFLSVDSLFSGRRNGYPVHHALLDSGASPRPPVLIIEDVNMRPLVHKRLKRVFALPIRFEGAEAAPVCVAAEIE
ncbi:MAG: cyclase family protein [Treponema sp.]|nr:cyclase family protein [Treponema sp.]